MSEEETSPLGANDQVNPDAASDAPTPETELGDSGSTDCSFSAIDPFKDLTGKTIESTNYLGGAVDLKFTDGTSARIEFVIPTDKINYKELGEYQKRGICVLSRGLSRSTVTK